MHCIELKKNLNIKYFSILKDIFSDFFYEPSPNILLQFSEIKIISQAKCLILQHCKKLSSSKVGKSLEVSGSGWR